VTAGANKARRLKSPLHGVAPGSKIERRWIGEAAGGVNLGAQPLFNDIDLQHPTVRLGDKHVKHHATRPGR
jgi:hypothetical protein